MSPLDYARLGLTVIPWKKKHEGTYIYGFTLNEITTSEDQVAAWMEQWPEADWAIVPRKHVVLDLENKNGLDGLSDFKRMCLISGNVSFEEATKGCPIASTRNNGRHIWYSIPDTCDLKGQCYVDAGIEIKCRNGQVHVPPSEGYAWLTPMSTEEEIPQIPSWLLRRWEAEAKKSARTKGALIIEDGNKHITMTFFAAKLRGIGLTEVEIAKSLEAIRDHRCRNPGEMGDVELHKLAAHFAKKEDEGDIIYRAMHGDEMAKKVVKYIVGSSAIDARQASGSEDIESNPILELPTSFDPMPDGLPLLKKWVMWGSMNGYKPQPGLQCLSFLCALSTIGGKLYSWRDARPNLYALGLAATGQGKEWILQSTRRLITEAGLNDVLGGIKFRSIGGIITELKAKPSIYWQHDEVTEWFQLLAKPNCPPYVHECISALLQFYGAYRFEDSALTEKAAESIENVFCNWYSTSQPIPFRNSLTRSMLYNGFYNRLIYHKAEYVAEDPDRKSNEHAVIPPEIIELLGKFKRETDNIVSRRLHQAINKASKGESDLIALGETPEATEFRRQYILQGNRLETYAHASGDDLAAGLLPRRTLMMQKLAIMWAIIENPSYPAITYAGTKWAGTIVDSSIRTMYELMTSRGGNNPVSAAILETLEYVSLAREKGRTPSELASRFRLKPRELDDMLSSLIASEDVTIIEKSNTGGRPSKRVVCNRYLPPPEINPRIQNVSSSAD